MSLERIMVAVDGSPDSVAAVRVAGALAGAHPGADVEVVGVVEPLPVFDTGFMVALPESELLETRKATMRDRVERTLAAGGADAAGWPVSVLAGLAAPTIADQAADRGASLVVTGLGRHGAIDRLFGTETVLQLLHLVHVPVLAVPADAAGLPTSAVLALDFSSFGYRAARAAGLVLAPGATLHLAHVLAGAEEVPESGGPWRDRYRAEVGDRLGLHAIEAGLEPGRTVTHLREGDPAEELLALVDEVDADLLAAGSHGHSFVGRLLLGSVSTRLVRGAHVPLLVVPPPTAPVGRHPDEAGADTTDHWGAMLREFSSRNAGRYVDLDVHSSPSGLRHAGRSVRLQGVDWDPRSRRVEVMLGEPGGGAGHFTHAVADPVHVEVVRDAGGIDRRLIVEGTDVRMTLVVTPASADGPAAT